MMKITPVIRKKQSTRLIPINIALSYESDNINHKIPIESISLNSDIITFNNIDEYLVQEQDKELPIETISDKLQQELIEQIVEQNIIHDSVEEIIEQIIEQNLSEEIIENPDADIDDNVDDNVDNNVDNNVDDNDDNSIDDNVDDIDDIDDISNNKTDDTDEVTANDELLDVNQICDQDVRKRIKYLLHIPQPEQKSQAWLDQRNNYITASTFGDACGFTGASKLADLLLNKVSNGSYKPFYGNIHTQWGEKYEDIANAIYCYRNKCQVFEFGLIPHPTIHFLGASTDGISDKLINIEIKCPSARVIDGKPKKEYWAQTQLQMEVLELEKTHFLECGIIEYNSEQEFFQEYTTQVMVSSMIKDPLKYTKKQITFIKHTPITFLERGLMFELIDIDQFDLEGYPKTVYKFSPIRYFDKPDKLLKWKEKMISRILKSIHLIFIRIIPWRLDRISCIEIARDREWFNSCMPVITEFWNDVTKYRKIPMQLKEWDILRKRMYSKYHNIILIAKGKAPKIDIESSSHSGSDGADPIVFELLKSIKSKGCMLGDDDDDDTAITQQIKNNNKSSCLFDDDPPPKNNKISKPVILKDGTKKLPLTKNNISLLNTTSKITSACLLDDDDIVKKPVTKKSTKNKQKKLPTSVKSPTTSNTYSSKSSTITSKSNISSISKTTNKKPSKSKINVIEFALK